MDQDSLIVHRGLALRPQVDRDSPIVHERPHAHWTMQARAEVASLIVATSVLVEARPPSALSASEHVPLLVLACRPALAEGRKQEGTTTLVAAWFELQKISHADAFSHAEGHSKPISPLISPPSSQLPLSPHLLILSPPRPHVLLLHPRAFFFPALLFVLFSLFL